MLGEIKINQKKISSHRKGVASSMKQLTETAPCSWEVRGTGSRDTCRACVKVDVLYVTRMAELAITVWSWLQGQRLREIPRHCQTGTLVRGQGTWWQVPAWPRSGPVSLGKSVPLICTPGAFTMKGVISSWQPLFQKYPFRDGLKSAVRAGNAFPLSNCAFIWPSNKFQESPEISKNPCS